MLCSAQTRNCWRLRSSTPPSRYIAWKGEEEKERDSSQINSYANRCNAEHLFSCAQQVFYADTLKFFLSLYGHKLPVLSLDISADSTLLASGSADKNVKIWGLDFGDCHKSFLAHTV